MPFLFPNIVSAFAQSSRITQFLKSPVIFNSSTDSPLNKCKSGFYKAFASTPAWKDTQYTDADLIGFKQTGLNGLQKLSANRTEDAYELLIKAIICYNGCDGVLSNSWAKMLTVTNPGLDSDGNLVTNDYKSNRKYGIEVMRRFGVPARTYIWLGGKNPADMPVMDYTQSPPIPSKNPNGSHVIDPEAGKDWCFAFGENEWMNAKSWQEIKLDAQDKNKFGVPKKPIGRVACQ